jgi:hypothetical protein
VVPVEPQHTLLVQVGIKLDDPPLPGVIVLRVVEQCGADQHIAGRKGLERGGRRGSWRTRRAVGSTGKIWSSGIIAAVSLYTGPLTGVQLRARRARRSSADSPLDFTGLPAGQAFGHLAQTVDV